MDQRRIASVAGVAGPLLFAAVFTVEGWLRPGYDPRTRFVSELSLGPRGWIQIASFVVYGGAFLAFARGMTRAVKGRAAAMLWGFGAALILAGLCVTDPIGTPRDQRTIHGMLHGLAGAYVFLGWPVCLVLLPRALRRDPAWRGAAPWTLAAGALTALLAVALTVVTSRVQAGHAPDLPVGLLQRAHIATWLAWQVGMARTLGHS